MARGPITDGDCIAGSNLVTRMGSRVLGKANPNSNSANSEASWSRCANQTKKHEPLRATQPLCLDVGVLERARGMQKLCDESQGNPVGQAWR